MVAIPASADSKTKITTHPQAIEIFRARPAAQDASQSTTKYAGHTPPMKPKRTADNSLYGPAPSKPVLKPVASKVVAPRAAMRRGRRVEEAMRANVRGEAGPTARQASRRKDDKYNLEAAGLPCRWASPRPRG